MSKPRKPSNDDFEHSLSLRQRVFRAEAALARANMAYVKAWLRYRASEDSHGAGASAQGAAQSGSDGSRLPSAAGEGAALLPSAEAAQAGTTSGAEAGTTTSADLGREPRSPSAAEMSAARAGKTILVVDDEEDIRAIIRTVLEDAGYRVLEAGDGQEALDLVCVGAPEAAGPAAPSAHSGPSVAPATIIVDCKMPGVDGFAFAGLYRALPSPPPERKAPLLALTAAHDVERRAREMGAMGQVGKPFRLDALLAEVDRLALAPDDLALGPAPVLLPLPAAHLTPAALDGLGGAEGAADVAWEPSGGS